MRRATRVFALAAFMAALFVLPVLSVESVVERVNGIGIIDYSHPPTFKVGDWVRYRMIGSSQMGMHDDYELTVLIGGEEVWWGEKCFWVETWTDVRGRAPEAAATLMSYAIFEDTLAIQHMQLYQRKSFSGFSSTGLPEEEITKPAVGVFKSRTLFKRPLMWSVDTLEADTVQTPMGLLHARKVSIRQGTGATATIGDSTVYNETRENRMSWYCLDVPITHIGKEEVENIISRKTSMIGRSKEGAPLHVREKGDGVARLIAFGHGLTPRMVPADRRLGGTATSPPHARAGAVPARHR